MKDYNLIEDRLKKMSLTDLNVVKQYFSNKLKTSTAYNKEIDLVNKVIEEKIKSIFN